MDAWTRVQTRKKTILSKIVIPTNKGMLARSVASGIACQSIA